MEPDPRTGGIEEGLAARIHDPLWLLSRQFQLGEFRGDDAGSPVHIEVNGRTHRLNGWRPRPDADWQPWDLLGAPIERLVEQEPEDPATDPRLRVDGAVRWLRAIAESPAAVAAFRTACTWPVEASTPSARGLRSTLRSKIPDGAEVAESLRRIMDPATTDAEVAALNLDAGARDVTIQEAPEWLTWWVTQAPTVAGVVTSTEPGSWDANRFEHAFALRSSTLPGVELSAQEYLGGRLDWPVLDVRPAAEPGGGKPVGEPVPTPLNLKGIPASARYGGMPAPRFWEMEDAQFDPGAIDAAPHDIGRLLLSTFATVYGNDWFVVPVRMPVGTLVAVDEFKVTDVFGGESTLAPAAASDPNWNLFGLTDDAAPGGSSEWFLLAPALPDSLEGPPIESVLLARDEMANLAWAVETKVADAAGLGAERYDEWITRERIPEPANPLPQYRVETEVPSYWYPLAPEQLSDMESVRLRLVPLIRRMTGQLEDRVLPLGELLAAARGDSNRLWLHEEEVPRSGAIVVRRRQRARWHDGSVHAWTARQKRSGTGESSSGLKFDSVLPPTS
jgi:hypothetical protein